MTASGRGRDVKEALLPALDPGYFCPAQHLAAGEEFRFLLEEALQKLDRITEIAPLDRSHGLEPIGA